MRWVTVSSVIVKIRGNCNKDYSAAKLKLNGDSG